MLKELAHLLKTWFQAEIKHRKRQTLAESYNFADENAGNQSTIAVPYEQ